MPAANKPEKAVARTRPEYRIAVLNASSFFVYQHDFQSLELSIKNTQQLSVLTSM